MLHLLKIGLVLPEDGVETNGTKVLPIQLLYRSYLSMAKDNKCKSVYNQDVLRCLEKKLAARMQNKFGYQVEQIEDSPSDADHLLGQMFGMSEGEQEAQLSETKDEVLELRC